MRLVCLVLLALAGLCALLQTAQAGCGKRCQWKELPTLHRFRKQRNMAASGQVTATWRGSPSFCAKMCLLQPSCRKFSRSRGVCYFYTNCKFTSIRKKGSTLYEKKRGPKHRRGRSYIKKYIHIIASCLRRCAKGRPGYKCRHHCLNREMRHKLIGKGGKIRTGRSKKKHGSKKKGECKKKGGCKKKKKKNKKRARCLRRCKKKKRGKKRHQCQRKCKRHHG